jgi:hypothetical protein
MVMVTRDKIPTKENVLQKGKRANKTMRMTKVVMVTRNEKPTKENVIKKLMMSIERRWKLPTTRQHVLSLHIIKSFPLQEDATDVLTEQTQDSSMQMSSAILLPSSNALPVVLMWIILLTSC